MYWNCVYSQVKKNLELGYGEEEEENPQLIKSINGGYKAYLNDKRKICVIDGKNLVSYTVFQCGILSQKQRIGDR